MNRIEALGIDLHGVVTAVPRRVRSNEDMGQSAIDAAGITGVHLRHHVVDETFASLALAAAARMMAVLGWEPQSITALVVVTQTPNIDMPSVGHVLHDAMGLPTWCPVITVNWACAGYVYGLWLASRLVGDVHPQRVLVIAGDTISTRCDPADRATWPIFGDAVSATGVEVGASSSHGLFVLGNNGGRWRSLAMMPGQPIQMVGTDVFSFTLSRVPTLVADLRGGAPPDVWLFHQANRFMLQHLTKKCALPPDTVPMNLGRRGNTSSASIPLLMGDIGLDQVARKRIAMVGFGAGWAWGGLVVETPHLQCAEVITA